MKTSLLFDENRCPSCGADWVLLENALNSPDEWYHYGGAGRGFLGKSQAKIDAEEQIQKCDVCLEHFGRTR